MSARRRLSVALALLTSACAQNAILELQVELPPAPATGPRFAQVQVRRAAGNGFDAVWMGSDPRTVELGDSAQWDCISVVTNDDTIDLNVRVRFCRESNCLGFGDDTAPERRYHLEHPFYIGRRTYWTTRIAAVPQCTTDADCEVGRCIDGLCGCLLDADCCAGCDCDRGGDCFACEAGGCVQQIDRCRIAGCIRDGDPRDFCTSEGQHICETSAYDRREAYMCTVPD